MNEHGFIRAVHRHLPAEPAMIKWKINDSSTAGKPDCYYCGPTDDLWAEYKYLKALPKRDTTTLRTSLTELQLHELGLLVSLSRRAWVVIGAGSRAVVLDHQEATLGITAGDFKTRALTFKELAERIKQQCGVI